MALVVPFDGTQSFAASDNVARVLNLTQRDYAYMRRGPGFKGTLDNVDVSSDRSIDHINIDKSPRLHARVVAAVLAVVGNHRIAAPGGPKPGSGAPAGAVTAPAGNKLEGVASGSLGAVKARKNATNCGQRRPGHESAVSTSRVARRKAFTATQVWHLDTQR